MAYFAAEVTLHRAIIRFDSSHNDETLRSITRAAAKMRFTSAIDLVNRLEPAHLQSFWYFASKVNLAIIATFGSLLWATSTSPEEAEFYRSRLAEYRWTLRVSSKAAEFMKFTVGMLDSSRVFMKDTGSKTGTPNTAKVDGEPGKESDSKDEIRPLAPEVDMNRNVGNPMDGVSPSVGYSTEPESIGLNLGQENLPLWTDFADSVNFVSGDVQDWSLDQLYNFQTIEGSDPIAANPRFVQEYDERSNHFSGF